MNIYAVANQKGGVSKTTTVQCIGAGLARAGFKVLLIDLDPQSNLTSICHAVSDAQDKTTITMLEILAKENSINDGIQHLELYDIIPSSMFLASIDSRITDQMARPYRLQNALKELKGVYDYVLIDCMPSLGMITINALACSNKVIVPVQAEYLAAKGMGQLLKTIKRVQKQINPKLQVDGVLFTLVDKRTTLSKDVKEVLKASYGSYVDIFKTEIPKAINTAKSSSTGKSIFKFDKNSPVAKAYENFAKEVLFNDRTKAKNEIAYSR